MNNKLPIFRSPAESIPYTCGILSVYLRNLFRIPTEYDLYTSNINFSHHSGINATYHYVILLLFILHPYSSHLTFTAPNVDRISLPHFIFLNLWRYSIGRSIVSEIVDV